ncbi:Uncharacterized protein LW93_5088 [Fusarium fujikuroi]|nr:Uncharacterized protein LW93_5088 [Fusarium fujikuroi]
MRPLSSFAGGAAIALGLASSVFAAPGLKACLPDDGIEVVELQPVEVICDGKTLTSTITRHYTEYPGSSKFPSDLGGSGSPDSPTAPGSPVPSGKEPPCKDCVTITTTVDTPFCTTIPPATKGGPSTVITGVAPPCEDCMTITTTVPSPFCTTIPPATEGGPSTVITGVPPSR